MYTHREKWALGDPVARDIVSILERCGFAVPRRGITRFGEPVLDGVIGPTQDGSIDEMLSSPPGQGAEGHPWSRGQDRHRGRDPHRHTRAPGPRR